MKNTKPTDTIMQPKMMVIISRHQAKLARVSFAVFLISIAVFLLFCRKDTIFLQNYHRLFAVIFQCNAEGWMNVVQGDFRPSVALNFALEKVISPQNSLFGQ